MRSGASTVETDGIEPPYLSRPKAIQRTSVPWYEGTVPCVRDSYVNPCLPSDANFCTVEWLTTR
ncbi:hypothetical protein GCM10025781_03480 [Kocuria gwangalliensis]|uniref:Uncharacterized protein n=1 Tax=Kocuria gwangalliensis TaxID=501592 RepID=A0ABP8WI45_9MICC